MPTRDEYLATWKTQLDDWSKAIAVMEVQAHTVGADVRAGFRAQLAALRAQRDNGENKLCELESASDGAWERVKREAESLWDAFKDSAATFKDRYQ